MAPMSDGVLSGSKDEAGGLGRGVVERGADERAGGAEDIEEGVDNCCGAIYDVAQAAEGAVEHEDVAGSHAEAGARRRRCGLRVRTMFNG